MLVDDSGYPIPNNLHGQVTVPGDFFMDLEGEKGIFFIFSKLCIKRGGQFRLRVSIFRIPVNQ
jgi:hypothetical protein